MRYQLKQRLWTLGDTFTIKDDAGHDVFLVRGKVFSIGDKLSFQDLQGRELAYIAQTILSFRKRYEIYRDGHPFAEVVKELTFLKDLFTVNIPGPNDYEVTGNYWDHEYRFTRGGRNVAHVSKAYFAWADTYGVDIVNGEDDITIMATAIVIDLVHDDERRR